MQEHGHRRGADCVTPWFCGKTHLIRVDPQPTRQRTAQGYCERERAPWVHPPGGLKLEDIRTDLVAQTKVCLASERLRRPFALPALAHQRRVGFGRIVVGAAAVEADRVAIARRA